MTACASAFAEDADTQSSVSGDISGNTEINTSSENGVSVDTMLDTSVNSDVPIDTSVDNTFGIDTTVNTVLSDTLLADTAQTVVDFIDDDDYDPELFEIADDTTSRRTHPNLVTREHEYRRQTRLAIYMMILIIAAFATSQSWNPN